MRYPSEIDRTANAASLEATSTYSNDGHTSVQIMRDPHPVAAVSRWSSDGRDLLPSASASEIRNAYGGYYAYFGTWEIDEGTRTVTHRIRGACVQWRSARTTSGRTNSLETGFSFGPRSARPAANSSFG